MIFKNNPTTHLITTVWLINGLFCKVLNLVPRHQEIVETILHLENGRALTIAIGLAETGMAFWIVSGFRSRLNAILQIVVIAIMNILESIYAPDLLLWGRWNGVFAFLFILVIYAHEFHLKKRAH
ncbi:DoxX-like family protein [Aequorivita todarodis]|uniref:DoxX-like family protein n=1 Tax=Aequorivita todarodis TaxID=2036821 RepID=UPI002350C7FA|nr:DoxX-like family protein [Aequorivita todarodis]MDC8001141.1 DoxX-like family protein [Aequorivita todarodis]